MGRKINDLSQLKKFMPQVPPPAPKPSAEVKADHTLAESDNSVDYFSSLLGGGKKHGQRQTRCPLPQTRVVTPTNIAKVREEQTAVAFAVERESLLAELQIQKTATDALAAELVTQKEAVAVHEKETAELRTALETERSAHAKEIETVRQDLERVQRERDAVCAEQTSEKEKQARNEKLLSDMAVKDKEIERLQVLLTEAQQSSLSASVLLDKPSELNEKFAGEIREHVLDTLKHARTTAEQSGQERRGRILEAVLCANASTGELERRRAAVRKIIQKADSFIDETDIAAFEKLGFRYISGNKHHKLDWAGIRFTVSKTPSDHRSALNSASEITNRVF